MFITEKKLRRNLMWMEMERTILYFMEECNIVAQNAGYQNILLSYENDIHEGRIFLTKNNQRYQILHIKFTSTLNAMHYPGDYMNRAADMIAQIMED